jgi:sporulation protein YabP
MAQEHLTLPHRVVLSERSQLTMTGVTEVVSFDETAVVLKTTLGDLIVQGSGLQLKQLAPDGAQVAVSGNVTSLCYQEPRARGGWLRRLLG